MRGGPLHEFSAHIHTRRGITYDPRRGTECHGRRQPGGCHADERDESGNINDNRGHHGDGDGEVGGGAC